MSKLEFAKDYLNRCSRCGSCQSVCPLYAETKLEPHVARGKVFLLKNYLDGQVELSPKMKELMSFCLLCKACRDQCPNKVPVDELVLNARQEIALKKGISFVKKNVFQHLLQNNGRLSLAARLAYLYQKSGLQWLTRKSKILNILGEDLAKKESLLPEMASYPFRKKVPRVIACSKPKLKVAYFTGCMTNYVFHKTGYAVLNILKNHEVEIVIPEQWCCGIPALASGDEKSAVELARKNIEYFQKVNVDAIITDCASCGSMLKEYVNLVDTPEANRFAGKVFDLSQFLVDTVAFRAGNREIRKVVTYHDPCHLKRGQGVFIQPRKLIEAIPGVDFKEMKEADRCCGAAGSFNLTYYDIAKEVGLKKVNNIQQTNAELVVTACPSCIMQLRHVLNLEGASTQVLHLAELINMSYSN